MVRRIPPKRGGRTSYSQISVINPGKGLNNKVSDNLIDDRESSSLENIQYVESGAPAKAYGFTSASTGLTNSPRGLGFYNDDIAGNKYLLTVDGTALKYLSGTTWTTISGATFSSTATDKINFVQARGSMYIFDGVNAIAKIASGLTLSRNGRSPKAKFGIYFSGRMFVAGTEAQPNRLYISKTTDASEFTVATGSATRPQPDNTNDEDSGTPNVPGATSFSTDTPSTANANLIDVNKFDGDKITGLAKFQDVLIIFKERAIYQLSYAGTSTDPTVVLVTKDYGCVSHKSIENVDNDVFFLTRNGIYVLGNEPNFFSTIRTKELSVRVHPEIETINPTNYTNATGFYDGTNYYLGLPQGGVTANSATLVYNKEFLAWSKYTHVTPESFCSFIDSTNTEYIYFTDANSANVYRFTTNYDSNGSAISAQWTSKAYDLGNYNVYKRWIDVTILFRQLVGTVTITIITDNGTIAKTAAVSASSVGGLSTNILGGGDILGGTPTAGSTGTGTSSTNIPYRLRLGIKSRNIKIKISNGRVNETFVVLGVAFRYRTYSAFTWPSALKIQ